MNNISGYPQHKSYKSIYFDSADIHFFSKNHEESAAKVYIL